MDSLVGYGSDDENESERYGSQQSLVSSGVLDKNHGVNFHSHMTKLNYMLVLML